ncbi:hypothetical protein CLV40_1021, partial [Actinokineospora auranticolor]
AIQARHHILAQSTRLLQLPRLRSFPHDRGTRARLQRSIGQSPAITGDLTSDHRMMPTQHPADKPKRPPRPQLPRDRLPLLGTQTHPTRHDMISDHPPTKTIARQRIDQLRSRAPTNLRRGKSGGDGQATPPAGQLGRPTHTKQVHPIKAYGRGALRSGGGWDPAAVVGVVGEKCVRWEWGWGFCGGCGVARQEMRWVGAGEFGQSVLRWLGREECWSGSWLDQVAVYGIEAPAVSGCARPATAVPRTTPHSPTD